MTGNKIIELKAQVKILGYQLDSFCNGELPEAGRKAVRKLMNNLTQQINDINKKQETKTDNQTGNYFNKIN